MLNSIIYDVDFDQGSITPSWRLFLVGYYKIGVNIKIVIYSFTFFTAQKGELNENNLVDFFNSKSTSGQENLDEK